MRIALKHDIGLPVRAAFAAATDFAELERIAQRRGIRVVRTDGLQAPGSGMSWDIGFRFRGRDRQVATKLTAYDPPRQAVFSGTSQHLSIGLVFSVVALSRERSRLLVDIELRPRTIRARLMIQSARLARGRIERTLRTRFETFADRLSSQAK
jgi:hypothetical protein